MKQVKIAGQVVPAIGIGTWHMGDRPAQRETEIAAIQAGISAGARVIDTAEMYGSGRAETLVGAALQPFSRQQLFLISKVLPENASRQRMEASLDASLQRLQTDYLDLYLYHWRGDVPLAETVAELQRLQTTGKIRAWGVSNFDVADLRELWQLPGGDQAAANEDLYHLGSRGLDYAVLPWQAEHDLPLIAYSPIAQGDAWGQQLTTNDTVKQIALTHQATVYQVLLAWVIRQPQVLAIPQTSSVAHMEQNLAAGDLILSPKELAALDQQYPRPTHKERLDII
ncbi:aldo/keto reductase [Levilactobacillus tujiorum]|uniref:Aldo/keto reductase n=1 Tax=Levilactobacillus tujiorum TaxID=2912243 RepID=A0ABX1L6R2_9LACO|nr:aldo/keto reductase [Levilactobacillus tujiorum]MCH5465330.1 aldo/keto reductase [Levilactobacillus tujiorum]NLR12514.1 aldo/keto reductase [Lactobacillus sp. HBUAS51387]NLR30333.1 aldo/keto reductase [Levilactobacillus tujiorum]